MSKDQGLEQDLQFLKNKQNANKMWVEYRYFCYFKKSPTGKVICKVRPVILKVIKYKFMYRLRTLLQIVSVSVSTIKIIN